MGSISRRERRLTPRRSPTTRSSAIRATIQRSFRSCTVVSSYTPPSGLNLPTRRLRVFLRQVGLYRRRLFSAISSAREVAGRLLAERAQTHPKYINDEIRLFVSRRGAENVIPLLLAGIPITKPCPARKGSWRFPRTLRGAGTRWRASCGFDDRTRHIDRGSLKIIWCFLSTDIYGKTRAEIERRGWVRARAINASCSPARPRSRRRPCATLTAVALVQRKARRECRPGSRPRGRGYPTAQGRRGPRNLHRSQRRACGKDGPRRSRGAARERVRLYLSNAQRRVELQDTPGGLWYAETKVRDDESIRIRLGTLLQTYPSARVRRAAARL